MKKLKTCILLIVIISVNMFITSRYENESEQRNALSVNGTTIVPTEAVTPTPTVYTETKTPAPTDNETIIELSGFDSERLKNISFKSKNVEDKFVIDIGLPDNYDKTKKYPVIYITDGNWRRQDYKDMHKLSSQNIIKDVITVGIGYPDSYDVNVIRQRDFISNADKFLLFIVEELIPYIDNNYSTDKSNRTLWGASHGGYFAEYSLMNSNDITKNIFKNYIIASPTLYNTTHKKSIYELETELFDSTKELHLNIYMTVGGLENSSRFIKPLENLVKQIEEHKYKGINLEYKVGLGKDHQSVWKPTLLEGVKEFLHANKN